MLDRTEAVDTLLGIAAMRFCQYFLGLDMTNIGTHYFIGFYDVFE